jgi:hypothetical protein
MPPEMEQMLEAVASTVMAAARPEVAWAVGVYVGPPMVAAVGAVEVKATV